MDIQKAVKTYNDRLAGGSLTKTRRKFWFGLGCVIAGAWLVLAWPTSDLWVNIEIHPLLDLLLAGGAVWGAITRFRAGQILYGQHFVSLPGNANESHQRGTQVYDARVVAQVLDRSPGDIEIGGVPLPRNVEQQHILVAGAPGSGKSVALKGIIKTIRDRANDGAVIHDPSGEFTALFYDQSRGDLIINPLDARHAPWSLWTDLMPGEESSLAAAIIPAAEGDNRYFSDAARATLEVLFQQTDNVDDLVKIGLGESLPELVERIDKAGLGGLVGSAKTFASVRGNMAPYLRSLALMPPVPRGEGVSLHEFCECPAGRFIFLLSSGRTRDTLAPIHQLLLNQIVSVATSLRPDPARRIWLVLDELPTLLPSPALATALSQGRKFGLSAVMALQAMGQMHSRVGQHESAALLSMPKTRLILRVGDGETAEAMSREIGERHIKRKQVSHTESKGSAGSAGTSTTWSDVTERAVLASQIATLTDLQGYLRIEDETMRVALRWTPYPTVADDYQPVPPRPLPVAPARAEEATADD